MHKESKIGSLVLAATILFGLIVVWLSRADIAVLNAQGEIAAKQRDLMITASLLSLIVVVPVFSLTFYIAWKYREGNRKPAKYSPTWDRNRWIETVWWLIPSILIFIISVMTWHSSHALDPFKPLASKTKPVTIQVVALDWKWLFIYPEENIATVNEIRFPQKTPVNFEITADAPMNSFWIPKLGGQVYAMAGMSTELHLSADRPGTFRGSSANISGEGFAGMHFDAIATSNDDYRDWLKKVHQSDKTLDQAAYDQLAKPSQNVPLTYYASKESNLYNKIVAKYMTPPPGGQETQTP